MSPVMFVMGIAAWFALDALVLDTWVAFFLAAVAYTVVYFLLAYRFMMNRYERDTIMVPAKRSFLRRVANKLRRILRKR